MATSRRRFLITCGAAGLTTLSSEELISAPAMKKLSSFDAAAKRLLATMTLDEKLGQMTQPDQMFLKSQDDLAKYAFGSLLSGGDSDPKSGNDLTSWTELYDHYQTLAITSRLRIPLLYGIDAVHGHNNVLGAVLFPQNIGLGCTRNPDLVERAARVTSEEVRATGINWAFAPCVTVPQDIRWGRTYEGYSESPDVVKVLGEAAVKGLQRGSLDDPKGVLACAKHFVGDGGTSMGTGNADTITHEKMLDQGDTRVDEPTLRRVHLPGYLTTIAQGVGSIMPSYNSWNGVKCSASKQLLTDLLKGELRFEGFLISDYAALNQLPGDYKKQIATSINAGMDMVMVPEKYVQFLALLKQNVSEGLIPMPRIDDAVLRILRVKFAMGMMESKRSQLADRSLHKAFGSAEHRTVARECVRASLVVLKNDGQALPLRKGAGVVVAGRSADNIGNQCGGWTIKWQGETGKITTGGTTILQALRKALGDSSVTYSADGSASQGAGVAVAVVGELPYAEMKGDRFDLRLAQEDVAVIDNLRRAGKRVIAVIVSGRPLIIDSILDKTDAIVAAWLPGTEGDGVADVLCGSYKPSGKLSFTWPRGTSTTLNRGEAGYEALYPFGHGLTY